MIKYIKEYSVQQLKQLEGKTLVFISEEDVELPEDNREKKKQEEKVTKSEKSCKKGKHFGKKMEILVVSNQLVMSPCYIATT